MQGSVCRETYSLAKIFGFSIAKLRLRETESLAKVRTAWTLLIIWTAWTSYIICVHWTDILACELVQLAQDTYLEI